MLGRATLKSITNIDGTPKHGVNSMGFEHNNYLDNSVNVLYEPQKGVSMLMECEDGDYIRTSTVQKVIEQGKEMVVETRNSIYTLEFPELLEEGASE